jgi:5-methylcytosine-specific restriction endonuclease McrA
MDQRRTEETKRKLRRSCRASVRRRRKLGLVPGRASTPERETERARKISEARTGLKFTEEHRRKLSLAHIGVIPKWKNPEERARKISLAQKGKPASRKKLLAIRKAGRARRKLKRPHDYAADRLFLKLRVLVLARDGNKCFQCSSKRDWKRDTTRIIVHHIDHEHSHTWMDNLITLCHGCNRRAENQKNKEVWERKFRRYTEAFVYEFEEAA